MRCHLLAPPQSQASQEDHQDNRQTKEELGLKRRWYTEIG